MEWAKKWIVSLLTHLHFGLEHVESEEGFKRLNDLASKSSRS